MEVGRMTSRQLTGEATVVPGPAALPIARNTAPLSAALATHSAMQQLMAAVASITLVRVLDVEGLLGLGPAVVLAAGALVALPAGGLMDRVGRVPVLAVGFGLGAGWLRAGRAGQPAGLCAGGAGRPRPLRRDARAAVAGRRRLRACQPRPGHHGAARPQADRHPPAPPAGSPRQRRPRGRRPPASWCAARVWSRRYWRPRPASG